MTETGFGLARIIVEGRREILVPIEFVKMWKKEGWEESSFTFCNDEHWMMMYHDNY